MATVYGIRDFLFHGTVFREGDRVDILLASGELLRGTLGEGAALQGPELDAVRADLPEALKDEDEVIALRVGTETTERSVYITDEHIPPIWLLPQSTLNCEHGYQGGVLFRVGDRVTVTQGEVATSLTVRQISQMEEAHHRALAPLHLREEEGLIRVLGTGGEIIWLTLMPRGITLVNHDARPLSSPVDLPW